MKLEDIHKPRTTRQPSSELAEVAFLDINDVCALARMSASWVHDEVRAGRFPQPMRFGPRCSRWRSAEVRAWLIARAESAPATSDAAARVTAQAKKASEAARAKRSMAKNTGGAV